MADIPYIQQAQEVKITGQDSGGTTVNYVGADANGNLTSKDYADGVPGSAIPPVATQIGGTDGTNLRTLSVDTSGRAIPAASSYFHPLFTLRLQTVTGATASATTSLNIPISS